jgi:aryl-alcohol dehydrogenase-like predicted oxidoreductase
MVAMSVLASGAIPAREAIDWVLDEPYVQSVVFGASSRRNIETTIRLINEKLSAPARG